MHIIENFNDIKGLYYIENYLSDSESDEFKNYIKQHVTLEPITNAKNSRRVAHFGYHYSYNNAGLTPAPKIPAWLNDLIDPNLSILKNINFNQIIINEYLPGQQIAYHTDHTKLFGPMIACVTVGQSMPIYFRNHDIVKTLNIKSGSMYMMTGESRYQWQHSLKNNSDDVRYSLTYRTV